VRSAARFTTPLAYHGEGPFWDCRNDRLFCVDVLAGTVVEIDSHGTPRRHRVPSRAATVIRGRAGSGYVVATEHGLVVANDELTSFAPFAEVVDDPGVRTNDGGCDPLGGFVIGTMDYNGTPGKGALYRVTSDRRVTKLLAPVSISNGVQWSADGTHAYYIDTPTRRVDVFDVDPLTGEWFNRRTHISIDSTMGFPDGMAIDEEDGLWIAMWGGGEVRHYDGVGRLAEVVEVPGVSQVSSCTFGGKERDVLFITTSRQGLPDAEEPDAGSVFSVHTAHRGAIPGEFAG
jgi:sugar lactone lactonase YvrE